MQKKMFNKSLWTLASLALVLTLLLGLALIYTPQVLTATGTPTPPPGDDWSTYLHDVQRSAASGEVLLSPTNVAQLGILWHFKTGGGIAASPIIAKNTVYVGSWDGYEYALDALTGYQKWKTYLGTTQGRCNPPSLGITSSATVQNDIVYVGGGDSYWDALDAYTGAILWKVFTGDNSAEKGFYNWSSPLIYKGYAYIGIASNCDNPLVTGELLKVKLASHQVVARTLFVDKKEVGGGIWTSPTVDVDTDTIYVTTGTQNQIWQTLSQAIVAIDAKTMQIKSSWQIPLSQSGGDYDWGNSAILFSDIRGRKMVAATNKNGFTYAFDRTNLSNGPLWEMQTGIGGECPPCGEGSVSSGTFAHGVLYMAGGHTTIHGLGYPGAVRAIDPTTGKYLWEHGTPFPVVPALSYANGLVIAGEGSTLEVLDAKTGTRLYSYETGDTLFGPAAISHGIIYTGSLDGYIYAFSLHDDVVPSDPTCPGEWHCQDIGVPGARGSEVLTDRLWNVLAGGTGIGGIGSSYDQIHFINQSAFGNVQITAQVVSQQVVGPASQAGLMVRQNTDQGSPFYAIMLTQQHHVLVQYRTGFAGAVTTIGITDIQKMQGQAHYLEIQRKGDTFQAAVSTDGVSYTLVPGSTVTLVIPYKVAVGFASSSGVNAVLGNVTYAHVTLGKPDNALLATHPLAPCPDGWICGDIGNPALVGNQFFNKDNITLEGSGKDIWGVSDQFHFVWRPCKNNCVVSTRIIALQNTDTLTKVGVMLRTSTDSDATFYAAFVTPYNGITVRYRTVKGLNVQVITTNTAFRAPTYLRIARWKNIFTTYVSPDGVTWNALGGSSVPMDIQGSMLGGIALTSHNASLMSSALFDSFNTTNTDVVAPTACPNKWSCADIGYPSPQGSQLFNRTTTTWTLQGGGFDIFFKTDQFHFVWQQMNGDSALSARVGFVTQEGLDALAGNDYAKGGLMLRKNTDAGSPYYGVFVTPQHGIIVQYRKKQGDGTGEAVLPDNPGGVVYLKIEHRGDIFTAYTSKDGVDWLAIDGSTIAIEAGNTLMAGLAITSHNPGAVRVVTFDTVNLRNSL